MTAWPSKRPRIVSLIGYRGCGKSAVGRELAHRLGGRFVDTDERIEADAGQRICDIFARHGEPEFRRLESTAIDAVLAEAETAGDTTLVLSVGGGAVLSAANRSRLKAAGPCVWLTATPEELHRRIAADPRTPATRPPLLAGAAPVHAAGHDAHLAEIRHLLAQREPLYAALADHIVPTDGRPVAEVVEAVLAVLPHPAAG